MNEDYKILWDAFWDYCYDKGEISCAKVIERYIENVKKKRGLK